MGWEVRPAATERGYKGHVDPRQLPLPENTPQEGEWEEKASKPGGIRKTE